MAYQRFLTTNDYYALITEEGLGQLIRGNEDRLAQAEQRAEMKIVDYLDQFYLIGKELERGKRIKDYSNLITYPSGAFFKKGGKIWKTCKSINACHKPTSVEYWVAVEELAVPAEQIADIENRTLPYLQMRTYHPGDTVSYLGGTWKCLVENGWDFQDIQIPGITYWQKVETEDWVANKVYELNAVVSYGGKFYAVIQTDTEEKTYDWSQDPDNSVCYGLIGDYDVGYNYSVGIDKNVSYGYDVNPDDTETYNPHLETYDYVVSDGVVYMPVLNPNAEEPEENVNVVTDDPRNYNLVNYMTAISLYYLNALIAPTNVSQVRVDMFEEAMMWVQNAAKMKIDPHIPRRLERETNTPVDDWAMAHFETNAATQVGSPWFL